MHETIGSPGNGKISSTSAKKLLKAKLAAQPPAGARSAFREVEKQYLTRVPPPDYSNVIDFLGTNLPQGVVRHDTSAYVSIENSQVQGERAHPGFKAIFTMDAHPGLFVIPDLLSPGEQRHFIRTCMRQIVRKPNLNNLDTHYDLPKEGLWYHFEQHKHQPQEHPDLEVQTLFNDVAARQEVREQVSRKLINDPAITPKTPLKILKAKRGTASPSSTVKPLPVSQLIYKLRWTNLGLMYHWTSKSYHYEEVFEKGLQSVVPVPPLLSRLSTDLLRAIPAHLIPPKEVWKDFTPESGIVNFYQLKDTLMGHVDQSELVEDKPLVSLSFGHTAVFLIGGLSRDTAPTAIYLRSGDALIMSGSCRRAFHGVPRIVEGTLPGFLRKSETWSSLEQASTLDDDKADWEPFADYLSTTRINVNIRQVFPQDYLKEHLS